MGCRRIGWVWWLCGGLSLGSACQDRLTHIVPEGPGTRLPDARASQDGPAAAPDSEPTEDTALDAGARAEEQAREVWAPWPEADAAGPDLELAAEANTPAPDAEVLGSETAGSDLDVAVSPDEPEPLLDSASPDDLPEGTPPDSPGPEAEAETEVQPATEPDQIGTPDAELSPEVDGCLPTAVKELSCDHLDDDCNGLTDEGFGWQGIPLGQACDGTGACGLGVVECAPGPGASAGCSTNPDGSSPQAQPEVWGDELDNDCDGKTDEDQPPSCDDGNPCTIDDGIPGACTHTIFTSDGVPCGAEAACRAGICAPTWVAYPTVHTGGEHACAIGEGSSLVCWGAIDKPLLGRSPFAQSPEPASPEGFAQATRVAPASDHTCAILEGEVWCWGYNPFGQSRPGGDPFAEWAPVKVSGVADAVSVATDIYVSCALEKNQQVRCWGDGYTKGEVVTVALYPALEVAVGHHRGCAVSPGGSVFCWQDPAAPYLVEGIGGAVALSVSQSHACALRDDGTIWCWGENSYGQQGPWVAPTKEDVALQATAVDGVVSLDVGYRYTCFVRDGGSAWCMGWNERQVLGVSVAPPSLGDLVEVPVDGAARAISAGGFTCVDRVDDGSARCWGRSAHRGAVPSPLWDVQGVVDAARVSTGRFHTCALVAGGTVRCWGMGQQGVLGNQQTAMVETPVDVLVVAGATLLASGAEHTCAVAPGIATWCWGSSLTGQIGNGNVGTMETKPVEVAGQSTALALAAGVSHTCVARADGQVWCWGLGSNGQCGGMGGPINAVPLQVPGVEGAGGLSAGVFHTCAILGGGSVVCWGKIPAGTDAYEPVSITGWTSAAVLASGAEHVCALDAEGQVSCFGAGGAVGPGGSGPTPLPVEVALPEPATALAAGGEVTCAAGASATWCWGSNRYGQLGRVPYGWGIVDATPGEVQGLGATLALALGERHACGVTSGGLVRCWGHNGMEQLGGDPEVLAQPLPVPGLDP